MKEKKLRDVSARPSLQQTMMKFAEVLSERSTCQRKAVGSVITDLDMRVIYGMGYNGSYAGGPNHCDNPMISGGCGCFPMNAQVETINGRTRIQDIRVGDMVLTHMGRYRPVTEVMTRPPEERDMVRFYVSASSYSSNKGGAVTQPQSNQIGRHHDRRFVSTANHPVLTERDGSVAWVNAGDLRVGDFVYTSGFKCLSCDVIIPHFREYCNKCFKALSKTIDINRANSERMKKNNPMHKLYNSRVRATPKNGAGEMHKKNQKKSQENLKRKLSESLDKYRNTHKIIITDHIGIRPDAILIDFEKKEVFAFEYERTERGFDEKKHKYEKDQYNQYDGIIWHIENKTPEEFGQLNGFAKVKVTGVEKYKSTDRIYNFEVEEDHSYVCQRIVVHNCVHAEMSCIINLNAPRGAAKKVFVTCAPCITCAKSLVNLGGVQEVYYRDEYKTSDGLDILMASGVKCTKMTTSDLQPTEMRAESNCCDRLV